MNERMSRISPLAGAEFKGAFLDTGAGPVGPAGMIGCRCTGTAAQGDTATVVDAVHMIQQQAVDPVALMCWSVFKSRHVRIDFTNVVACVPPAGSAAGLGGNCVWLVWMDEGDYTLYDMMTKREFPYNLEPILLDRELRLPRHKKRRLVTLKLVLRQLLEALEAAHATGIGERSR